MSIELADIERALASHEPFIWLPEDAVVKIARAIEVQYLQAGTLVLESAQAIEHLYFIRSGEVEVFHRDGALYNRLSAGHVFGQIGLMMQGKVRFPVKTLSDCLFYLIPAQVFFDCCDQYLAFGDFFEANESSVLEQATQVAKDDMTTVSVMEVVNASPLTVGRETSIAECASQMTESYASAALVLDHDRDLVGIVTDGDLRARVLAEKLSYDLPIERIMTPEPEVMDDHSYLHEVMLTMLRHNIHHVPIVNDRGLLGLVSLPDVVSHESNNSLLMVRSVLSADSIDTLVAISEQLPQVYSRLVNEQATAHMIGSAMSVIGSSFMQQLVILAEEKLGPPPVPFCLLALGSLARDEQLLVTDQDNALILDDSYDADLHGEYFSQLGNYICDGLAACGYPYCEGGIMASNPKWRMTVSEWKAQFTQWIEQPDAQALLNVSIFFDLVAVAGKKLWVKELQQIVSSKASSNKAFLAALARNGLKRTPPLGFFKNFVLEEDGRHAKTFNIKRRGTAPLSDVIRVHALASGSTSQNSFERLEDVAGKRLLPDGKAEELSNALELLYSVRARQQMLSIRDGVEPNNQIPPDTLSLSMQKALKEAFNVVTQAQKFLRFRYTAGQ